MKDILRGPELGDAGGAGGGTPTDPSGADPSQGSPDPTLENWRDQLIPEDIREEKMWADIKTPQDAMKMLHNSQKLIGGDKVAVPKEDSPPEVIEAFLKAAGRPDDIDGYAYAEDFTEDQQKLFDEEGLKGFKELLHKNGASNKVFQEATKWYADYMSNISESANAATESQSAELLASLKKEWVGEDYKTNMAIAQAAMDGLGDEQLTELVMGDKVLRNHPSVIKLFHRIGMSMQDHKPLELPSGGNLRLDSATHAKQELAAFEDKYADVLMGANQDGSIDREEILAQRFALMQKAYPGETSGVQQNDTPGFTEFNVRI